MTNLREAAEMALETLPLINQDHEKHRATLPIGRQSELCKVSLALRQALAQPEQEPMLAGSLSVRYFRGDKAMTNTYFEYLGVLSEGDYTLYTAPPKREPLMTKYVIVL